MLDYFFQGGPVMYPLLLCSLTSLTTIIERTIFWVRVQKKRNRRLLDELMSLIEKEQYGEAKNIVGDSSDFVIRVIVCGVVHRDFSLRDALQMSADEEIARMKRYLPVLDTMVTLSPLLGILGTVTGIIYSFNMLGVVGVEHPEMITAGIAQALITTAFGLIIAIPSLICYNYFLSKIEKAALEMEKYGTTLEIIFEKKKNGGNVKK
ncbi:MAG: MotA/TolQ/ExbB proton channel family protein [Syntrophales bacterium]